MNRATKQGGALRELLYCWVARQFSVLVPKKRGDGYLKVPYGRHAIPALTDIAYRMGCDVIGLDGALDFQISLRLYCGPETDRVQFASVVTSQLEAYYGIPSREIAPSEFWRRHPVSGGT